MIDTLLLLSLAVILVTVWIYKRYQRLYFLIRCGIPGPKPNFFMGNVSEMHEKNVPVINKWIKEYGKVFSVNEFGQTVYIADADLARQVLVKDFPNFHHRRRFIEHGGADANPKYEVSILSHEISFERWREQRALIASAFTTSKMRSSAAVVNEGIDDLIDNIRELEGQSDFDIYDLFQRLTMDTIGRSAFGTKLNVQKNPDNDFFEATKHVFDGPGQSLKMMLTFFSLIFPEFFSFFYPIRVLQRILLSIIGSPTHFGYQLQMCIDITNQRKRQMLAGEQTPDDLLQRLIDASLTADEISSLNEANPEALAASHEPRRRGGKVHRMNDAEIAANASVMFDAGYETTSSFLGFLTHVLVTRQDIQEEVRKEVMQLIHDDGQLEYNTLHSLPYLDSVMYETLRYYPPVTAFVSRQSVSEYKYKDITIPADVSITVAMAAMHHDPEYWEKPELFDPLRFYGDNKVRIQSPAFQAFGSGPRNCVGMRFALMESKLTIARLVSQYKLVPGPRTQDFDKLAIDYKIMTQNPKSVYVKAVRIN
jgi:cytochrome P450